MSDYTPVTEFVTKDSLSVNDPLKKVVGSELDAEFDAIATAIASKMDATESGAANGVAELNANSKLKPAQMWANVAAPARVVVLLVALDHIAQDGKDDLLDVVALHHIVLDAGSSYLDPLVHAGFGNLAVVSVHQFPDLQV